MNACPTADPSVTAIPAGTRPLDRIYLELGEIFQEVFDDETIVVTPELAADDVPEWDSMSHIRLVLAVQKHFDTKFSAAEITALKNVGDLARLIGARLAPR